MNNTEIKVLKGVISGRMISEIITERQRLGIGSGNEFYASMKVAYKMT